VFLARTKQKCDCDGAGNTTTTIVVTATLRLSQLYLPAYSFPVIPGRPVNVPMIRGLDILVGNQGGQQRLSDAGVRLCP